MKRLFPFILAILVFAGLYYISTRQGSKIEEKPLEAPPTVPTLATTITPTESHATKEQEITPTPTLTPTPAETPSEEIKVDVKKEKWYPKLKKSLLAFQEPNTKVFMEGIQNHIFGDEMAVVLVTYIKINGNRSSFKALVEKKSGLIIRTWDQTQVEPFKKEPKVFSPAGRL